MQKYEINYIWSRLYSKKEIKYYSIRIQDNKLIPHYILPLKLVLWNIPII